jgi:hypothetical protein
MSSSINLKKFRFNKCLYKAQKKTNQCIRRNGFWVRDEWLQPLIFSFLVHLTKVFLQLLFCKIVDDPMHYPLIFFIKFFEVFFQCGSTGAHNPPGAQDMFPSMNSLPNVSSPFFEIHHRFGLVLNEIPQLGFRFFFGNLHL